MKPNRYFVMLPLAPLLAMSWLVLALVNMERLEQFGIGAIIGTIFGQTTLASAWTALGPGPVRWRLPLALAWCVVLIAALALSVWAEGPAGHVVVMMAVCVAVQWLLVQVPLWWLAVGYGLRLRHRTDPEQSVIRPLQFGIRQLMLLTAIVAVLLGAGRGLTAILIHQRANPGDPLIFAFLVYAGVLMMLPLLLAALLPRYAVWGVLILLGLIAAATWAELPLLEQITPVGGGPDFWHFVWINFFQSAWIVLCVALLRGFGYGVGPRGESPFASTL